MVKPKTFAHAVDLKWGGTGCKSHYCQVLNILAVMMSFTLILLVVHKTPPETIALHLKKINMAMATISKHAQFIKSDR